MPRWVWRCGDCGAEWHQRPRGLDATGEAEPPAKHPRRSAAWHWVVLLLVALAVALGLIALYDRLETSWLLGAPALPTPNGCTP